MKKLLFIAAMATFALVSCDPQEEEKVLDPTGKIELSEAVIPFDGGSVNATITTNFDWSIEVTDTALIKVEPAQGKGNATVTVTLAKNTTNKAITTSAVMTVTNADKNISAKLDVVIPAPYLEFGGVKYAVTYMKDGKYWMSENLRYVPEGEQVYEPAAANTEAKIWYPATISYNDSTKKYVAAASQDSAVIAAQGLLYSPEYVLGGAYCDSVDFVDADYTTAICPAGWHIPSAQEWIDLVGACADSKKNNAEAPYYNSDLSGASLDSLNADGLNLLPYPYVNNNSYLCNVANLDSARVYNGMNSMSYFLSTTGYYTVNAKTGKVTVQGYAGMITNNKTKTSVNVARANLNTGISVRYVKD